MGSTLIFNDTLNLDFAQGFPADLILADHIKNPYQFSDVADKVYNFKKDGLRYYHAQPVPVFLVQNIDGRWHYWGIAHVLNVTLDYVAKTTSGQFKIVNLLDPDYMEHAHKIKGQP